MQKYILLSLFKFNLATYIQHIAIQQFNPDNQTLTTLFSGTTEKHKAHPTVTQYCKSKYDYCTHILHKGRWKYNQDRYDEIYKDGPDRDAPVRTIQQELLSQPFAAKNYGYILEQIQKYENAEKTVYIPEETRPDWFTRVYNPNTTEGVSFNGNSMMQWDTKPAFCTYKIYQPTEVLKCFQIHYPRIQIFGDSRARQYYSSLKPILSKVGLADNFFMWDDSWKFSDSSFINYTDLGIWIDQAWTKKALQIPKAWIDRYGKYTSNPKILPDLVIMPAMILHPLVASGAEERFPEVYERLANKTDPFMDSEYKFALEHMEQKCLPFVKFVLRLKPSMKFIFIEAEKIGPNRFEFDADRNYYIDKYNLFLRDLIPDDGINDQIYRMSVSTINSLGEKANDYLLPDRIHLSRKDTPAIIPPTLLVNWNVMFNLLCNRYLKPEEPSLNGYTPHYCCSKIY